MSDSDKLKLPKLNFPDVKTIHPNVPILDKDQAFLASAYHSRITDYIIDFEKELNENEEVGAKIVSFGQNMIIHVDDVGYWNPRLLCFHGRDTTGERVQLIQHVNQISILLIKVERSDKNRTRVGFKLTHGNNKDR